jgi:hypothetical protein
VSLSGYLHLERKKHKGSEDKGNKTHPVRRHLIRPPQILAGLLVLQYRGPFIPTLRLPLSATEDSYWIATGQAVVRLQPSTIPIVTIFLDDPWSMLMS